MILVVEYNDEQRSLLVDRIRQILGRPVEGVSTAREMITSLKRETPECLVVNFALPDINGKQYELLKKVRLTYSPLQLPIVLLAGEGQEADAIQGLENGCNDCIFMPMQLDLAVARIRNQLHLKNEMTRLQSATETVPDSEAAAAIIEEHRDFSEDPTTSLHMPDHIKMTLKEWVRGHHNEDEADCLAVLIETAHAIAYAHEFGIVHREFGSENVVLMPDGMILVNDIGVGSPPDVELRHHVPPTTNPVMGMPQSPVYASPEQLLGREATPLSDIYHFGNLAYEIMCGRPPFYGLSLSAIVDNQLKAKPPSIIKTRLDVNLQLEHAIFKCIEKAPEDRYQSMAEVVTALERLAPIIIPGFTQPEAEASEPGPTEPPPDFPPPQSFLDPEIAFEEEGEEPLAANAPGEWLRPEPEPDPIDDETLDDLVERAMAAREAEDSAQLLTEIIEFIWLVRETGDADLLSRVRNQLSDSSVLKSLLEKNLNESNQQLLYEFFKTLEYDKAVLILLHFFKAESDPFRKMVLGELAVLSAGKDVPSLVIFGLELEDSEASVLLKAFGQMAAHEPAPIFLKWSKHGGYQTQTELLKTISSIDRPDEEIRPILEAYAAGTGTVHRNIREMAGELLRERLAP